MALPTDLASPCENLHCSCPAAQLHELHAACGSACRGAGRGRGQRAARTGGRARAEQWSGGRWQRAQARPGGCACAAAAPAQDLAGRWRGAAQKLSEVPCMPGIAAAWNVQLPPLSISCATCQIALPGL
jgi:hypothetical protein